jgi:malate permease and related proteins
MNLWVGIQVLGLKLFPLLGIVGLGFIAGRHLRLSSKTLGDLIIYIIAPIFMFGYIATMRFQPAYVLLPVLMCFLAFAISFGVYWIGQWIHGHGMDRNLQAAAAGDGNNGYFGVPLFMALFPREDLGLYIWAGIGALIYSFTLSYYFVARTRFNFRKSMDKLLKLPVLYAAVAGLIASACSFKAPDYVMTTLEHFRGTYIVIGMMALGMGLSGVHERLIHWKFLLTAMIVRFGIWPALVLGFIEINRHFLHAFDSSAENVLITLSIVPMAVNTVVFASQVEARTDKIASTVLVSTVVSLAFTPIYITFLQVMGIIAG